MIAPPVAQYRHHFNLYHITMSVRAYTYELNLHDEIFNMWRD